MNRDDFKQGTVVARLRFADRGNFFLSHVFKILNLSFNKKLNLIHATTEVIFINEFDSKIKKHCEDP